MPKQFPEGWLAQGLGVREATRHGDERNFVLSANISPTDELRSMDKIPVGFIGFAEGIGNSATILACHSGGILSHSSTMLNNKQDASGMTFPFYFCRPGLR
jgi:hypothetical protein